MSGGSGPQVFFSVTFMGMGAGQAAAIAPDVGKAKPALLSIFRLLDTVIIRVGLR
jgi:hypothetical protein